MKGTSCDATSTDSDVEEGCLVYLVGIDREGFAEFVSFLCFPPASPRPLSLMDGFKFTTSSPSSSFSPSLSPLNKFQKGDYINTQCSANVGHLVDEFPSITLQILQESRPSLQQHDRQA